MILETAAIIVIPAMLLLLGGFLLIPLHVSFRATRSEGSTEGEFSVRWLGLRLFRRKIGAEPATKEQPPRKRRERLNPLGMARLLRESVPSFVILFKASRRSISFRRLSATVDFGLGDPAETAYFSGCVWAFSWALNLMPRVSFVLRPDLERERFDGSVAGELGVRLLPLVVGFLRAYMKKPFRQLVGEARKRR